MATKGGSGGHGGTVKRPAKKHRFEALLLLEDVLTIPEIAFGVIGFVERKELRGVALVCKSWKKAAADRIRSDGPAILVTGGLKEGFALVQDQRDTWVFLPKREIWRSTSPLPLRFAERTAQYLKYAATLHGFVYVVGETTRMARYSLLDEVWNEIATEQVAPAFSVAESIACLNDTLYVMYREEASDQDDPYDVIYNWTFYSFDPINLSVSLCKRFPPQGRGYHKTIVFDDYFYLVGGVENDAPYNAVTTVERWRPGMDELEAVPSMHTGRYGHCLAVVNGQLFALGGMSREGYGRVIKTCEKYCPKSNDWHIVTSLLSFRYGFSAVAFGKLIYVIGGKIFENDNVTSGALYHQHGVKSVDVYNTDTGEWSQGPSMPKERFDLTSV